MRQNIGMISTEITLSGSELVDAAVMNFCQYWLASFIISDEEEEKTDGHRYSVSFLFEYKRASLVLNVSLQSWFQSEELVIFSLEVIEGNTEQVSTVAEFLLFIQKHWVWVPMLSEYFTKAFRLHCICYYLLQSFNKYYKKWIGGRYGTEVAFALLTQQPGV